MLMLIDTPDPRYRPDRGGDGPGRPRIRVRTVLLLGGSGACIYASRFVTALIEFALLVGSFALLMVAMFSLWMRGDEPSKDGP